MADLAGRTALLLGASLGNNDVLKTLLKYQPSISATDVLGYNSYHISLTSHALASLAILLDHYAQADPEASKAAVEKLDHSGRNLFHHLAEYAAILHSDEIQDTQILCICQRFTTSFPSSVRLVLHKDFQGLTPLHFAALSSPAVLKLCLAIVVDVNPSDNHGITPLHAAYAGGLVENIKLFQEAKADLKALNCMEETPAAFGTRLRRKEFKGLDRRERVRNTVDHFNNSLLKGILAMHGDRARIAMGQQGKFVLSLLNSKTANPFSKLNALDKILFVTPAISRNGREHDYAKVFDPQQKCTVCQSRVDRNSTKMLLVCADGAPVKRKRLRIGLTWRRTRKEREIRQQSRGFKLFLEKCELAVRTAEEMPNCFEKPKREVKNLSGEKASSFRHAFVGTEPEGSQHSHEKCVAADSDVEKGGAEEQSVKDPLSILDGYRTRKYMLEEATAIQMNEDGLMYRGNWTDNLNATIIYTQR
jgi:ankyrin repeat protein